MQVSMSDFRANVGKYVKMADKANIFITRNGKSVAKLVPVNQNKKFSLKAVIGAIPSDMDYDKIREERLYE